MHNQHSLENAIGYLATYRTQYDRETLRQQLLQQGCPADMVTQAVDHVYHNSATASPGLANAMAYLATYRTQYDREMLRQQLLQQGYSPDVVSEAVAHVYHQVHTAAPGIAPQQSQSAPFPASWGEILPASMTPVGQRQYNMDRVRTGRSIVIALVGFWLLETIIIISLTTLGNGPAHLPVYLGRFVIQASLCVALYRGRSWARGVMGILSVLSALAAFVGGVMVLSSPMEFSSPIAAAIGLVLGLLFLLCAAILFFSSSVKEFVDYQGD
jgi:hypothetical protein